MNGTLRARAAFFFAHAGYSWNPKTQTEEQGKRECAERLARAEEWASANGYSFDWRPDHVTSKKFSNEQPPWMLWQAAIFDPDGTIVGGLGGVDFGRDGQPWGDNYRRVVEAELALEVMP